MHSEHWIDTIRSGDRRARAGLAALIGHHLGQVIDRLLLWAERSRERHRLAELDDHMLRDIGLSRADVMAEATKPFWHS
jgi:uncharacterized protein YjiS (DUF1127 family)